MIRIIELPQVGESVTEGVIGKWLVEPGQHVEKYDPLVEVVTDKVSMEAPSPYTGVFVRALAEEGETVPMGQPICEMEVEEGEAVLGDPVIPAQAGILGGDHATRARAAHEEGSGAGSDEPPEAADESEPVEETEDEPADEDPGRVGGAWAMPAAQDADAPESAQDEETAQPAFEFMDSVRSVGPTGSGEHGEGRPDALQDAQVHIESAHETPAPSVAEPDRRHVISPLVARLSAQYGIDLSTLRGTGTGGRITSKDLLDAVNRLTTGAQEETPEAEAAPEAPAPEAEPEAAAEAAPEDEETSPLPVGEDEGEGTAAAEAEPGVAAEQPVSEEEAEEPAEAPAEKEQVAEGVVEEEAEAAAHPAADDEPPGPVIPAQAETQGAWAAQAEAEERTEAPAETEPVAEDVAEEEADEAAQPPADDEPPSPVFPAQAGIQGARAAHEETEEPAQTTEGEQVAEEASPEAPAAATAETSVLPLTPVRRIIAEHMARSSREIPAAWSMVEVDATRLVRTRDALKATFEAQHGIPLTYLPFAASAVAAALREHPRLNARWDDGHITLNNRVNLAVAVSTEAGLMVPVLRDADTLTIAAIAADLRRLTDGARAGTLAIDDVQGGTFTLNNTGALGSVVSVPIINHPQAAIMTTEAIVKRPVVVEGDAIAVRSMMNLCLTFDHRVCDGAEAAAFLSAVKSRLEAIDESIELG